MSNLKRFSWLSLLLILAMVMVACGGGDTEEAAPEVEEPAAEVEQPAEEVEEPAEEPMEEEAEEPAEEPMEEEMDEVAWAVMPGGFMEQALNGDFAGTTVTFDGPFADIDAVLFEESVAPFEEATGIDINYIGDKEFEGRIGIAVDGGNAPDIADFPQPGLLGTFARQGLMVDPTTWMSEEWLLEQYDQSWLDMATVPNENGDPMMGGTWYRMNTKSQVYYPKAQFDAAGYEVPETWDELLALTQLIADDGDPAWCIGIESGAATGWAATDWTEEMMLRTAPLEAYDGWVKGTHPFDSPEVRNAMDTWSEIWFNPDYVFGGTDGIVTTNFGDSPAGMFEDPPNCWLHKQGSFITGFFPEGTEFEEDWDFFYLPPVDDAYGRPYLVAGDLNGMFNDRPEVRAVMEFMTTPQSLSGWLENGGALSPHLQATPDMYGQPVESKLAEFVAAATAFRFDASDLMPGEVGAGSFWAAMTDYVSGAADLDTVLPEIDASWPAGVEGQESITEEGAAEDDGEPTYLDRAMAGEFAGTEVTLLTVYTDKEEVLFNEGMASFEEATGIDVVHSATKGFETEINVRLDAGDPPDVAMIPQPGMLDGFVQRDYVPIDVREFIPEEDLQERYAQGWLDSATFVGTDGEPFMAGVWYKAANKDQIWYPKAIFDEAGYEVPATWDELVALSDQIVADGDAPWCIGIGSGDATGWVATDWVERLMLRTAPPEDYDAWVAGELPFASDQVKHAAEVMSDIWLNPDYVLGGADQIVTETIQDSPVHMFEDPPSCWMHVQASWVQGFFPEDAVAGEDYDFFYFPGVDPAYGEPVLMAGDVFTMFNDRPEARAYLEYISTGASTETVVRNGSGMSPHQDSSLEWYTTEIDRRIAENLLNAEIVRFDASDLMPAEVGAGSFWERMVDYVAGTVDLDTALQEIDDSWPQ